MVTSRCALVMGGLFLFGLAYNAFVTWLEQDGRDRGYTGILVIVGTLVTLGGYAVLVEFDSVLLAAFCFAASGTPMAVGSMWRHIQRREREERETRDLAKALASEYLFWNQEIAKAINANKSARQALGIILDENPPARWALRLALVSRYLAENLDAVLELRMIVEDDPSEDR